MTLAWSKWSMKSLTFVTDVKLTVPNLLKRSSISFFLLISLPPQNANRSVESHTSDVVNESDFRALHLHFPGLSSEFKDNGPYLGASRRSDGMAFGKQTSIHIYRDGSFLVCLLALDQIFSLSGLGKSQILVGKDL